nr:unnamed protein product [Digitaria exilis]
MLFPSPSLFVWSIWLGFVTHRAAIALESEADGEPGAKRRREDDEQEDQHKEVAAGPVVRISALPDDVRRRILTHLPLKDAIRSSALAQRWRHLWKSRWAEPTSSLDVHVLPGDNPKKTITSLESAPRRRLDRFTFVSDNELLGPKLLSRFMEYAAACCVEDLDVEVSRRSCRDKRRLIFNFVPASPLLTRLSLRNVILGGAGLSCIGDVWPEPLPFYRLEVVRLHRVTINLALCRLMASCPRVHTLDMRRCDRAFVPQSATLRTVTVAECGRDRELKSPPG